MFGKAVVRWHKRVCVVLGLLGLLGVLGVLGVLGWVKTVRAFLPFSIRASRKGES